MPPVAWHCQRSATREVTQKVVCGSTAHADGQAPAVPRAAQGLHPPLSHTSQCLVGRHSGVFPSETTHWMEVGGCSALVMTLPGGVPWPFAAGVLRGSQVSTAWVRPRSDAECWACPSRSACCSLPRASLSRITRLKWQGYGLSIETCIPIQPSVLKVLLLK